MVILVVRDVPRRLLRLKEDVVMMVQLLVRLDKEDRVVILEIPAVEVEEVCNKRNKINEISIVLLIIIIITINYLLLVKVS